MAAHQWIRPASARRRTALGTGMVVLLVTVAAGCTGSSGSQAESVAGSGSGRSPGAATAPKTLPAAGTVQTRDVVRTATLQLRTADVDRAADSVVQLANGDRGRVDRDQRSTADGRRTAEVVLRVPPSTLESVIAEVDTLGTEVSRSVHGQDVTATRADIGARVSALTASVDRLRGFLAHSGSISDLVSLEGQLTQREADLESMQAQQRALSDQIALATLTVDLSMRSTPSTAAGPAGFGSALGGGWHALVLALRWTLAGLGYLAPIALVVALATLGAVVLRRRRRHKAAPAG